MENMNRKISSLSNEELHEALNKKLKQLELDDYENPYTSVEMLEQTLQLA